MEALYARLAASIVFVEVEILQLPDGTVARFLAQDTGLAAHRVPLNGLLETKPHRLSSDTD